MSSKNQAEFINKSRTWFCNRFCWFVCI